MTTAEGNVANLEVVKGFIAQVLVDGEEVDGLVQCDEEGCFEIRRGSAKYSVAASQTDDGSGIVQVGSVVLRDVPLSKRALTAVNSINSEYVWVRCAWEDGMILIVRDIPVDIVTAELLVQSCNFIGEIADAKDDEFKTLLGAGTSAYDGDLDDDDSVEV
jgi:hypothetical protein